MLITEDWLRSVGFKWHQLDRQNNKQWLLWLGGAVVDPDGYTDSYEDLGIELAHGTNGDWWFCWLRADYAGRYSRFLHVRHLLAQEDLIRLIEALTGQQWDPTNNIGGSMRTPEAAERMRQESKRLDRLIMQNPKWKEQERDDSRGRALPEHLEAAIKSGLAK